MRKKLLILFISSALCLMIAELFLHFFMPADDPFREFKNIKHGFIYSEYPKDFKSYTLAEEGLPGMDSKVRKFSTYNFAFRGDHLDSPKPADEFRIFAIGGSTTENFYLDDSETWTMILQNDLAEKVKDKKIKVFGAAKSGDRIDNHISMLSQRVIHLQPDMVIVLVGINDLLTNATGYDPYHFPADVKLGPSRILKLFATEFQIPRYTYKLLANLKGESKDKDLLQRVTLKSDFKEKVAFAKNAPEVSTQPIFKDQVYKEDLESLIGITKLNNVQLVLVTQATSWNSKIDPQTKNWHWLLYRNGKYYQEDVMEQSMMMVNDITKEVGEKEKVLVYDLANNMPKSLEYFYDDVHFNVKGAKKFGEDLSGFLLNNNLIVRQHNPFQIPTPSTKEKSNHI